MLVAVLRDLWVLMAELATLPENRAKLDAGTTAVTAGDGRPAGARTSTTLDERFDPPTEFVVPGGNVTSAWLDLARTVVRRAERHALAGGRRRRRSSCRTSTGCRTCCGRWPAGRTPPTARRCACATSAPTGRLTP